jgi:gamma-glutamyl:cysteine ligase YbdK (ATP-grasp superfamily)
MKKEATHHDLAVSDGGRVAAATPGGETPGVTLTDSGGGEVATVTRGGGSETGGGGLGLFEGYGIEIEWMTLDATDLSPRGLAPHLLTEDGELRDERERGEMAWSNELAMHVIEAKTSGAPPHLEGLAQAFSDEARAMNARLADRGACVVGGGAHPFMDPAAATLWTEGQSAVYRAYDRIFGTQGHGWVNLQSVQLNLPFQGDEELARLHAATRLVLPLLPALSAASPYLGGELQPFLDARLDTYRRNQAAIPAIAGHVIPEPITSAADYHQTILSPMYAAIAPHDPDFLLQEEWLNSRGAIVRFDRSALEIRVIDCQESPRQDLAVIAATVEIIRALVDGHLPGGLEDRASTERLARTLWRVAADADEAVVDDPALLAAFAIDRDAPTANRLWRELVQRYPPDSEHQPALDVILDRGPLARRMVHRAGPAPQRADLQGLLVDMAACLAAGSALHP